MLLLNSRSSLFQRGKPARKLTLNLNHFADITSAVDREVAPVRLLFNWDDSLEI
jgi:hypothetical protein